MATDANLPVGNITFEATGATQEPQKKRGRPKGSKNKDRASEGLAEEIAKLEATRVTFPWVDEPYNLNVKLASEHVEGGLDSIIKTHAIVGVSALPNGMASIITNIGTNQPFILVTAEPYSDVVEKLFPGAK